MLTTPELPDDIDTRKTALTAERAARQQAEARASGAEAMRAPLPAHLPRERVVVPVPSACPCCGGKLVKLGEDVT